MRTASLTSPMSDIRLGVVNNVSRRGLHAQVVDELGARIMRGDLQPGHTIDPDALVRDFGVSRTVVREAIKVLTAKGLVDARPRLGTYVTERAHWQLLDGDVMGWRTLGEPDPLLVVELGEVRRIIEPAAARMAAQRRSATHLATIADALERLESTASADDPAPHVRADIAFHAAVLDAAGNELLQRFEVVLEPALHARDSLAYAEESTGDFLALHRAVFEAIRDEDAARAFSTMESLMHEAAADTARVLRRSEAGRAALAARSSGAVA